MVCYVVNMFMWLMKKLMLSNGQPPWSIPALNYAIVICGRSADCTWPVTIALHLTVSWENAEMACILG